MLKHLATVEDLLQCDGARVAIDIETNGLQYWNNRIIGVGFYCPDRNKQGYVFVETEAESRSVKEAIQKIASNPASTIIAHNLKFECHFLGLSPSKSPCKWLDTMVMVHLYDSRLRKSLEAAADYFLGIPETKRVFKERGRNKPIWEWPLEVVSEYCVNDCKVTYDLATVLIPKLREMELLPLLVKDMKYLGLIIEVERRGMLVDINFVNHAIEVIRRNVTLMEEELYSAVGKRFSWKSHQQLSRAIYDDLGIAKPINPFADADGVDRSKFALKGHYNSSCTSSFLLMEKANHPLGPLILDLRESEKLVKTYLQKWLDLIDPENVIHASFNLTGTRTGRLSSSAPNMQNLPGDVRSRETQSVYSGGSIRSNEYNLRQAFIARPGHTFLSIDYKQQEMRMFGILAQEPIMLESLRQRRDIHADVAEAVWGSRDEVHREWSKTIGFGQAEAEVKPAQLLEAYGESYGNQQPGSAGMQMNGSETDSATRTVAAAMPFAA